MNATLSAAALCVALGFMLGHAPPRALAPSLAVLVALAFGSSFIPWPAVAHLGAWISVILTVAWIYSPKPPGRAVAVVLAANAGLWSGAVMAADLTGLLIPLPLVLISLPTAWLIAHRGGIAVKIVASWLVAVAVLAVGLPTLSTPASTPDHME